MYTIEEVQEAHQLLTDYLAQQGQDDYITSTEALEIAKREGCQIPSRTLINTCTRETLQYAKKRGKRWTMPRSQFDIWYAHRMERNTTQ